MSDPPLLVKISRDGKEIGTYEAKDAVRLLLNGTLKGKDFYWHEGMTEWAPLSKLETSETYRQLAEKAKSKADEDAISAAARWDAKKKADEDAISAAARVLWVKNRASDRLDEYGFFLKFIVFLVFVIGGAVLMKALGGDDDGSAIRQQVRTLQMTNGILLLILGCIIAKR